MDYKLTWRSMLLDWLLASFSLYHVVLYIIQKTSPVFILLTLVMPGCAFFWNHNHHLRILDILRCIVGMSKNPQHYKYYLQGIVYGWLLGWTQMTKNTLTFLRERREQS